MARRKDITSKKQFDSGLLLEQSGDSQGALKFYQKATTTDPSNTHAWNRQMVLYRKNKSREQEVNLIQTAIEAYQKSAETKHQDWLIENKTKADSSRELAQVLGLLEPTGIPKSDDSILEKWQTRLYLLEYRIKNARKKKPKNKKPTISLPLKSQSKVSRAKSGAQKKRSKISTK